MILVQRYHGAVLPCLLAFMLFGPAQAETGFSVLVNPHWLSKNLQNDDLLVIDTRAPIFYDEMHIPGAINIPVEDTFSITHKTYRVGGLQQIKELFRKHGINHGDHIAVYDDGRFIDAARFFWVLEVYGHQRVSLMDGGFSQWVKSGRPTEQVKNMRQPSDYIPTINYERLTSKLAMQIALNNPAVRIIDARTENEYLGKETAAERAGHIPSAVNIPWTKNMLVEQDLTSLLHNFDLIRQYAAYKDSRVITYCNRGKQSALTYFALRHLGYEVSVYDGAWLEWANDTSLPIE